MPQQQDGALVGGLWVHPRAKTANDLFFCVFPFFAQGNLRYCVLELFDERNVVEVVDPEDTARRYALCRNPWSAERETATRNRLLELTGAGLAKIAASKRAASSEVLGARVGRVLQQYKMGKFIEWAVEAGHLTWRIRTDRVKAEAVFDGCYIIVSNVSPKTMNAQEMVESYKKLQLVEMAFRNLKTVQLEMRPMFHKTDDRIRAHVFLCMLAYHLQWHAQKRPQPLFDSDARGKDRQWSFQNVLQRLKSIRRAKVTLSGAEWRQTTQLESDQEQILEYLKIRL